MALCIKCKLIYRLAIIAHAKDLKNKKLSTVFALSLCLELWLESHLTYFYLTATQSIPNGSNMDLLKAIKEVSHGNSI